jgi:hypothetical protein
MGRGVRPRLNVSDGMLRAGAPRVAARAGEDLRPMQYEAPSLSFISRLFGRGEPRKVTRRYAAQVREGTTRAFPCGGGRLTVHCRNGEAWITHDGDPRDVVLQAPQSYLVDRGERMTLHALKGDCVLEFEEEL